MGVIKCPECGHQTSEKATICPSCGVEIAGKIVKCTNCGEVFFKDDGLCPHCYRPYQVNQSAISEDVEPDQTDTLEEKPVGNDDLPTDDTQSPTLPTYVKPSVIVAPAADNTQEPAEDDGDDSVFSEGDDSPQDRTVVDGIQEKDKEKEYEEDEDRFIDTDAEQLERPTQELGNEGEHTGKSTKRYIPIVVSIAITALIAAVCLYFYNDSKSIRELQAFNSAMENGDVEQLNSFLRDFTDASASHKQRVKDEIKRLNKQEQDLSLVKVSRNKTQLLQFLSDYPDSPMKKDILATIDSLDWEDARKANTKEEYEKYLAEHAQGVFVKEAKDKITVKEVAATEDDANMARSLFREFFLSVNGNDATRLTNTLSGEISNFMGTEKPSSGDVVSWMKRQHGENVSSVIWKLNHDYKINKREQNGSQNYTIDFTAKQTIVQKDGRSSSENYRISSHVTEKGKIASMTMSKYTPQPGENTGASSSKPATSSTTSSKPATPSKPTTSSSTSSKPATPSKPTASSSTSSKPATPSKPATSSSTSSKPATPSKPTASSTSSSKPATASKPAASGTTSSKPATPSKPASSSTSSSKPATPSKPSSAQGSSSQGSKK